MFKEKSIRITVNPFNVAKERLMGRIERNNQELERQRDHNKKVSLASLVRGHKVANQRVV